MKFLVLIMLLLPLSAHAQPHWRMAMRTGQQFYLDDGYDLVTENPFRTTGELSLEYLPLALSEASSLGIGMAYQIGGAGDVVHGHVKTDWLVRSLSAHAVYRWAPGGHLAFIGRVGPAHQTSSLALTNRGTTVETELDQWGVLGGIGVDLLFNERSPVEMDQSFFGFSLEFTYAYFPDLEMAVGGTPLGVLAPSGPGWQLGFSHTW